MSTRRGTSSQSTSHLLLVQQVVGLWFQMQDRLQAHFASLAAEHSLTAIQAKVLLQLDAGTHVTTSALASRLQYDPSNLTRVIDKLEARGAVHRQPDPGDRRVKGLVITASGEHLRDLFWQRLISDVGPLGTLSTGELEQLRSILLSALAEPTEGEALAT